MTADMKERKELGNVKSQSSEDIKRHQNIGTPKIGCSFLRGSNASIRSAVSSSSSSSSSSTSSPSMSSGSSGKSSITSILEGSISDSHYDSCSTVEDVPYLGVQQQQLLHRDSLSRSTSDMSKENSENSLSKNLNCVKRNGSLPENLEVIQTKLYDERRTSFQEAVLRNISLLDASEDPDAEPVPYSVSAFLANDLIGLEESDINFGVINEIIEEEEDSECDLSEFMTYAEESYRFERRLEDKLDIPTNKPLNQVCRSRLLRHISEEPDSGASGGEEDVERRSCPRTPSTPRSPGIDIDDVFKQKQKEIEEGNNDDMSRVRDLTARLNLATRRPSYLDWLNSIQSQSKEIGKVLELHPPKVLEEGALEEEITG
nr:suppressor protein SRP40-like [Penaeus vannamei]